MSRQGGVGFSVGPGDLRGLSENFMVLWMISNRRQETRVEGEILEFGMELLRDWLGILPFPKKDGAFYLVLTFFLEFLLFAPCSSPAPLPQSVN